MKAKRGAERRAEERVVRAAMRYERECRKILCDKAGEPARAVRHLDDTAFSLMRACAALSRARGGR